MGRAGLIMMVFLLFAGLANAQLKIDFSRVDSSMYQASISENWDEVIQVGKEALHHDIDYFYLRMRMGLAYFNKQHYRNSAEQMEKAIEFNPEDPLVKEYLYYALIYSGQDDEAARASSSWRQSFKEEKGIEDRNGIDGIYLETGPEISNNFDENEMGRLPQQFRYREQDLYGNSYYSQLGINLNIKPHITMYAAYSNLIISRQVSVQYKWGETDSVVSYDYNVRQNSFYLNGKILLAKGWSLTPAINYIHVKTEDISIDSLVPIGSLDAKYDIRSLGYSFNNMVWSLAFNKQIAVFDLGLFGSYSNLNNMSQMQFGFSAIYYPFGNLNFYGNTTIKGLFEEHDLRPVFSQMLAVKASSFLWIEGFGAFGNLRSTNESNAFVVYNITDDINLKAGLNLIFVISPSVQLSLRYQYMQKEGERTEYSTDLPEGQRTVKLKYTNQSIIGGLKWTF
jgi:tetratricopeptide (TPR) repeat protein